MLTTFSPTPPVASKFVQAERIAAQCRFKQDQWDANEGNNFGTQEDIHQPQWEIFNECLVNVPTFETEYQDFVPLKRATEAVFVEAWDLYTKQVTDNMITQRLQKYSTDKLATADTEDSQT